MGVTPRIVIGDISTLQRTLAKEFEARAADGIARRERIVVALSGGSVGSVFFPTLAVQNVDWTRVEIFWADERAVPPEHPDSNFALASTLLLVPARVPAARVHRMPAELPDLEYAARRAADELKAVAGDPPHLDLAILGVGDDGHVASLFPRKSGAPAGASAAARGANPEAPVVAVYDSPKAPERRLTLTLAVLADADLVVVAAFGASKAAAMRAALHESGAATPVAELLRRASSSLVLLDRDAGLS